VEVAEIETSEVDAIDGDNAVRSAGARTVLGHGALAPTGTTQS
jgi:hypothetical protein